VMVCDLKTVDDLCVFGQAFLIYKHTHTETFSVFINIRCCFLTFHNVIKVFDYITNIHS